ncbi:MAG: hypothetical protein II180_11750 [Proteobacteria bacterium]|nr:hypothetical protein [Pseudomonadota bacterium]
MRIRSGKAFIAALAAVCILCGCQSEKKKISEMSDEEKVMYEASQESSLSEAEMADQIAVRREILKRTGTNGRYEAKIAEAMASAREVLDDEMYGLLESSQTHWERGGRGEEINRLVRSGVPAADAFGEVLRMRSEWISLRASRAMLIASPGVFGGYYRSEDGRGIEVYEMGADRLNFVLRVDEDDFVFTASGTFSGEEAALVSETDPKAAIVLKRAPGDALIVVPDASFETSSVASYRSLIEGHFDRVLKGGYDVFSR